MSSSIQPECLSSMDFNLCSRMRDSFRQYLAMYGLKLAFLVYIPLWYISLGKYAKEYIGDILFPVLGIIGAFSISLIIVISVRAFCRQVKLNVFYIRTQQTLRRRLVNHDAKCSKACGTAGLPLSGIRPLRKQYSRSFYLPHEPSEGYFLLVYIIALLGVVHLIYLLPHLMCLAYIVVANIQGMPITTSPALALSWFGILFLVFLQVAVNQVSKSIGHLTSSKCITEDSPDPLFQVHPHIVKIALWPSYSKRYLIFTILYQALLLCLMANGIAHHNDFWLVYIGLVVVFALPLWNLVANSTFLIKYHNVQGLQMVVAAVSSCFKIMPNDNSNYLDHVDLLLGASAKVRAMLWKQHRSKWFRLLGPELGEAFAQWGKAFSRRCVGKALWELNHEASSLPEKDHRMDNWEDIIYMSGERVGSIEYRNQPVPIELFGKIVDSICEELKLCDGQVQFLCMSSNYHLKTRNSVSSSIVLNVDGSWSIGLALGFCLSDHSTTPSYSGIIIDFRIRVIPIDPNEISEMKYDIEYAISDVTHSTCYARVSSIISEKSNKALITLAKDIKAIIQCEFSQKPLPLLQVNI